MEEVTKREKRRGTNPIDSHPINAPNLREVRLENIALKENIKVAFTKSPITRLTLAECVLSYRESAWTSISSFPELRDLSIQVSHSLLSLSLSLPPCFFSFFFFLKLLSSF